MKKVKFVGGPFHGSEHEVADDVIELRLPVTKDSKGNVNYLRYIQPKADEFVYNGKDIGDNKPPPVLVKPDEVHTNNYIFRLKKLDKAETRGHRDQTDWCKHHIIVEAKHPCYKQERTIFKIWSFMNEYTIELVKEPKFGLSYAKFAEGRFITDFIYGLGKILEQNGYVNSRS